MSRDVYFCDPVRTPIGRYAGVLAHVRADDLRRRIAVDALGRPALVEVRPELARRAATNERLTSVLAEIHAQARALDQLVRVGLLLGPQALVGPVLLHELLLPAVGPACVAHQVLADMIVGGRVPLVVEAGLPGRRQTDQDHTLRHGLVP